MKCLRPPGGNYFQILFLLASDMNVNESWFSFNIKYKKNQSDWFYIIFFNDVW